MSSLRNLRRLAIPLALVAFTFVVGSCGTRKQVPAPWGAPWTVEIEPVAATNPVGTQHTFVATVYDRGGRPLPNVEVRWILPQGRGSVGDITAFDDQMEKPGRPRPVKRSRDRQEAASFTNEGPERLGRECGWVPDERKWRGIEVGAGQTWCRISAARPGESQVIAYVPSIPDATRQKAVGVKYWGRLPLLRVGKQSPGKVLVGSEFEYRVAVRNDGLSPTPGSVIVTDVLPDGVTVVDGTRFPLDLGRLDPGASETVSFRVRADSVGMKVNTAEAQSGPVVATGECVTEVYSYGIDLVNDCEGVYGLGDEVTFSLRVAAPDHVDLEDVVLRSPLPAEVEFVSARGTSGRADIDVEARTVVWAGFGLGGGEYEDLTIVTRAVRAGHVVSEAEVTAVVAGTKGEVQVEGSDSCACDVVGAGGLRIDKECLTPLVPVGEPVEFVITVWNEGPGPASRIEVVDVLPAGFVAEGETWWLIDILPPSGRAGGSTMRVNARGELPGLHVNVATVSVDDVVVATDSAPVNLLPPVLTMRVDVAAETPPDPGNPTLVNLGESAKFTLTVRNGVSRAYDGVVVLAMPAAAGGEERVQYVGSNPPGTYDPASHVVRFDLDPLDPDQLVTLEVLVTASSVGPQLAEATVTALGFDGAVDPCRLFVQGAPDLGVSIVDALDGDPAVEAFAVGTRFDYVIAVSNPTGTEVRISPTFTLTGGLELEPGAPAGFVASVQSTQVTEPLDVAEGAGTFTIAPFVIPPGGSRFVLIPARGSGPTPTAPAVMAAELDWQLLDAGQPLALTGTIAASEETTIGQP